MESLNAPEMCAGISESLTGAAEQRSLFSKPPARASKWHQKLCKGELCFCIQMLNPLLVSSYRWIVIAWSNKSNWYPKLCKKFFLHYRLLPWARESITCYPMLQEQEAAPADTTSPAVCGAEPSREDKPDFRAKGSYLQLTSHGGPRPDSLLQASHDTAFNSSHL